MLVLFVEAGGERVGSRVGLGAALVNSSVTHCFCATCYDIIDVFSIVVVIVSQFPKNPEMVGTGRERVCKCILFRFDARFLDLDFFRRE